MLARMLRLAAPSSRKPGGGAGDAVGAHHRKPYPRGTMLYLPASKCPGSSVTPRPRAAHSS